MPRLGEGSAQMRSTASPKKQATPENRHDDWFYDELMTAQPDATQLFLRERLAAQRPAPPRKKPA